MDITGQVLQANSDFYTFWNIRKETFLHLKDSMWIFCYFFNSTFSDFSSLTLAFTLSLTLSLSLSLLLFPSLYRFLSFSLSLSLFLYVFLSRSHYLNPLYSSLISNCRPICSPVAFLPSSIPLICVFTWISRYFRLCSTYVRFALFVSKIHKGGG